MRGKHSARKSIAAVVVDFFAAMLVIVAMFAVCLVAVFSVVAIFLKVVS